MISVTTAELNAWIVAFFFPLARILSLLVVAPPFNNAGLTARTRLMLGLAISLTLVPTLNIPQAIDPASGAGLLILVEQMLIGFALGFSIRLIFSAIDLAGNAVGMQMGLGFATAYDPQSASQTGVVSEFLGILALLVFMAINGHLMVLAALTSSFQVLPIGHLPGNGTWLNLANAGGTIFSFGLMLALPFFVVLLITNIALGILGRVAPQLNLMAIGFPITIMLGFSALYISLPYLSAPFLQMFEFGMQSILGRFVLP